jgi:hypothetical protein
MRSFRWHLFRIKIKNLSIALEIQLNVQGQYITIKPKNQENKYGAPLPLKAEPQTGTGPGDKR